MSMPPRCPRAASTSAPTPAWVAASPGTGWPPIPSAAAPAASASRSLTTTRAPSAAIRIAMARPIPCPAPVTTTPLPCTSMSDTSGECHAAVDDEDLPGEPGRVLGEQEGHDTADVLRHAEPLERVRRGDLVLTTFVKRGGEPRLHHGGRHHVDADVGAEVDQRAVDRVDAGVVHQQVDAAERLDGLLDGIGLMLDVVGLACDGDRVVGTAQRRYGLVQRPLLAGGDADLRAVCDQPLGDAEADAPARSGHHGDLVLEPARHDNLSRIMAMPWPPPTHMVSRPNCPS